MRERCSDGGGEGLRAGLGAQRQACLRKRKGLRRVLWRKRQGLRDVFHQKSGSGGPGGRGRGWRRAVLLR